MELVNHDVLVDRVTGGNFVIFVEIEFHRGVVQGEVHAPFSSNTCLRTNDDAVQDARIVDVRVEEVADLRSVFHLYWGLQVKPHQVSTPSAKRERCIALNIVTLLST